MSGVGVAPGMERRPMPERWINKLTVFGTQKELTKFLKSNWKKDLEGRFWETPGDHAYPVRLPLRNRILAHSIAGGVVTPLDEGDVRTQIRKHDKANQGPGQSQGGQYGKVVVMRR